MSRSSSAVERGPGDFPPGALRPAEESGHDRLRIVEGSDQSPEVDVPVIGNLRLALVTASGFKVPLVTSPAQAARLLRSSGEAHTATQRGDGDLEDPTCRKMLHPRRVPVDELLSRGRLVCQFETPLGDGAA
jgi:hypothetical protein